MSVSSNTIVDLINKLNKDNEAERYYPKTQLLVLYINPVIGAV